MDYKDIIKQELNKVSNSKFAKLTDKQLAYFDSDECRENAKRGGKTTGYIQGKKNVSNKFWEKLTFEQRSNGGKTSHKKHVESGHWENYIKIGTKASVEARQKRYLEKQIDVLNRIKTDTFVTSDLRKICDELEYKGDFWKKLLRNKELVEQIHKGYNQFNPSIYKKII